MRERATRDHRGFNVVELMERLGIEPYGGVLPSLGLRYANALQRCESCQLKDSCCAWLDHAPALLNLPPRFCPNADILFELQFDQPGLDRKSH